MSSSCCGGKCGCGSDCKCGNGYGGLNFSWCKMYPDMSSGENTTTETLILGVTPNNTGRDTGVGTATVENGGCKCSPCTCESCNCK